MEVNYIHAFFFSFIATVAFAVLFQAPKRTLLTCGIIGGVGWLVFAYLNKELHVTSFNANFAATMALTILCELSARFFKEPATIYIATGVIPIVPGLGLYKGMAQFVAKNYDAGMNILVTACSDALAIAIGIMVVTSFFRVLTLTHKKRF